MFYFLYSYTFSPYSQPPTSSKFSASPNHLDDHRDDHQDDLWEDLRCFVRGDVVAGADVGEEEVAVAAVPSLSTAVLVSAPWAAVEAEDEVGRGDAGVVEA